MEEKNKKKISAREAWRLQRRAAKLFYAERPALRAVNWLFAAFKSLSPYVLIFLSAQIIAESPTDYLAITAVNYVDAEMPQGDGTSITVQNSRYTYELIPKDEFCSDSYASRTVQWVD